MLEHAYAPETLLPYLLILSELVSSISWPIAAFTLIFVFRTDIKKALDKLKSFTAGSVKADFVESQGIVSLGETSLKVSLERLNPNVLRSLPITEIEASLSEDLAKIPSGERESQLLTSLAQARLEGAFNLAYANIYGSQIRALKMLNERGGKMSRELAESEFKNLQSQVNLFSEWSLDQYLHFLRYYLFIDEIQGELILTDYGREFLAHLSRKGLSEDRLH